MNKRKWRPDDGVGTFSFFLFWTRVQIKSTVYENWCNFRVTCSTWSVRSASGPWQWCFLCTSWLSLASLNASRQDAFESTSPCFKRDHHWWVAITKNQPPLKKYNDTLASRRRFPLHITSVPFFLIGGRRWGRCIYSHLLCNLNAKSILVPYTLDLVLKQ